MIEWTKRRKVRAVPKDQSRQPAAMNSVGLDFALNRGKGASAPDWPRVWGSTSPAGFMYRLGPKLRVRCAGLGGWLARVFAACELEDLRSQLRRDYENCGKRRNSSASRFAYAQLPLGWESLRRLLRTPPVNSVPPGAHLAGHPTGSLCWDNGDGDFVTGVHGIAAQPPSLRRPAHGSTTSLRLSLSSFTSRKIWQWDWTN
jgi:hypothetical protein